MEAIKTTLGRGSCLEGDAAVAGTGGPRRGAHDVVPSAHAST